MARLNTARKYEEFTAEGAQAFAHMTPEQALRRSVMSCMLWEDAFYVDGEEIGARIAKLARQVAPETLAALAGEARHRYHLRHAPLLLAAVLAETGRGKGFVSNAIANVVARADELTEFLAVYAKLNGQTPDKLKLSKQVKLGLAQAFANFDEYQLAKYNRGGQVQLAHVMKMVRPKPATPERADLYGRLLKDELAVPDTWEVELSRGANKRDTFTRLLQEQKLGYLALLRNLRGMLDAGVDLGVVRSAIRARKGAGRVLPFRYVAAARAAPRLEDVLDEALLASLAQEPKLPGKTVVILDVSGSMGARLSARSDMTRIDVAAALGAILREVCADPVVYATAGNDRRRVHKTALVPARHGMALIEAIGRMTVPLGGGGIFLTPCLRWVKEQEGSADRIVVITDEQDCAREGADSPLKAEPFGTENYLINISVEKNGIGYGPKWTRIDGWSDSVVKFITATAQGLQASQKADV